MIIVLVIASVIVIGGGGSVGGLKPTGGIELLDGAGSSLENPRGAQTNLRKLLNNASLHLCARKSVRSQTVTPKGPSGVLDVDDLVGTGVVLNVHENTNTTNIVSSLDEDLGSILEFQIDLPASG